jgi:hypothetical protein
MRVVFLVHVSFGSADAAAAYAAAVEQCVGRFMMVQRALLGSDEPLKWG